MAARKTRIAIVGAGGIGRHHIRSFKKVEKAEVVAVSDADPQAAARAANDFQLNDAYDSIEPLLKRKDIDALLIATPNAYHAEMAIATLRAGKDCLCEKPMAATLADAKRMVAVARRSKNILTIGFTNRFGNVVQTIRESLNEKQVGRPYHLMARALRRLGVPGWGSWFTTKKLSGGGALIDIGCHVLDLALWLVGNPRPLRVSGKTYCRIANAPDFKKSLCWGKSYPSGTFDVDDYATALIRLEGSITLQLECSWAAHLESEAWSLNILAEKGGALVNVSENHESKLFSTRNGIFSDVLVRAMTNNDKFLAQAEHFVHCVRKRRQPLVKPEQALQVQQIIDAIYRSSQRDAEVAVR